MLPLHYCSDASRLLQSYQCPALSLTLTPALTHSLNHSTLTQSLATRLWLTGPNLHHRCGLNHQQPFGRLLLRPLGHLNPRCSGRHRLRRFGQRNKRFSGHRCLLPRGRHNQPRLGLDRQRLAGQRSERWFGLHHPQSGLNRRRFVLRHLLPSRRHTAQHAKGQPNRPVSRHTLHSSGDPRPDLPPFLPNFFLCFSCSPSLFVPVLHLDCLSVSFNCLPYPSLSLSISITCLV